MLSVISQGDAFVPHYHEREHHSSKVLSFHKPNPLLPEQNPLQQGKPTLVLDLDQTLVDSSFHDLGAHDFTLDVIINGSLSRIYMWKRPGLDHFLQSLAACYELVLFTAAERSYAEAAIDEIDPLGLISHRLFKDACTNGSVKDLSKLGRNMKRIIIVDDNPVSFVLNPANGLQIGRFYCDNRDEDEELPHLAKFLRSAALCTDLTSRVAIWNINFANQACAYRGYGL